MRIFAAWLLAALCLVPPAARAADKTPDVSGALAAWVEAIESRSVDKVVALYDDNSVMLSAFANDPLTTKKDLRAYFTKAVREQDIHIDVTKEDPRVFGDVAVNTGLYTFHYTQEGETLDLPARFSFVYVLKNGQWLIISQHSSRVPSTIK